MSTYDGITIRRLSSGSYQYRVRDPNTRRYEPKTFKRTDEGAKRDKPGTAVGDRWAKDQLARFQLGQATAEPAALASVVSAYLAQIGRGRPKERPVSGIHLSAASRILNNLAAAMPRIDFNKHQQAKASIRDWLHGVRVRYGREPAPTTRRIWLQYVQAMLNWAVREGIVMRNPAAGLTVEQHNQTIYPTLQLSQARALVAMNRTDSASWIWIMLMLYGGMRSAEAWRVRWEDILWPQNIIRTLGKGNKLRPVPMQPELRSLLMALGGPEAKHPRIGRIVGDAVMLERPRAWWWSEFRRVLRIAGIQPDLGIDPVTKRMARLHAHSCRHTFAGMMLASGIDSMLLQLSMGHEDNEMTQHYAQSATMFRSEIEKEGWKPGELRLMTVTGAVKAG